MKELTPLPRQRIFRTPVWKDGVSAIHVKNKHMEKFSATTTTKEVFEALCPQLSIRQSRSPAPDFTRLRK